MPFFDLLFHVLPTRKVLFLEDAHIDPHCPTLAPLVLWLGAHHHIGYKRVVSVCF